MNLHSIKSKFYSLAWDTRCRNVDVARLLRPLVRHDCTLLDAGCGENGVAAFVNAKRIVGVDIPAAGNGPGGEFTYGSILGLPFGDGSFDIVVSVDVFEHLPENLRDRAVEEMVRCASETVVMAFPAGRRAREIDENFEQKLKTRGEPVPDWLEEHLANPYPDAERIGRTIEAESERRGRKVSVTKHYSESLKVARTLRAAAALSKYLYLAANLAAGFFLPVMPRPSGEAAYRTIIVAEFDK